MPKENGAMWIATLTALMLGGAAGFLAGWRTAPVSGREMKRMWGRRLDDRRHDVMRRSQRALSCTVDRVGDGIESRLRRLNRRFA
jgi:hypothetical protein